MSREFYAMFAADADPWPEDLDWRYAGVMVARLLAKFALVR